MVYNGCESFQDVTCRKEAFNLFHRQNIVFWGPLMETFDFEHLQKVSTWLSWSSRWVIDFDHRYMKQPGPSLQNDLEGDLTGDFCAENRVASACT